MSQITIIEGNNNDKDNTRVLMVKGEAGATISSIEKTSTSGLVDTYTVTISDGRTQTFTVTNGKSISTIEKTGTSGLVDTYTITFNDLTTQTFTVTNGKDGIDGYSPTATVTKTNSVATISITDKNGTTTATVNDGAPGYEVPAGAVIGWDSNDNIPAGYEETDNPNNYSTTETKIGTWVDGKPLYRKIINFGVCPNNTTKGVDHNISNLKRIIHLSGFGGSNQNKGGVTLPHASANPIALYANDTQVVVIAYQDASGYTQTYIWVEYTKTTD